MKRSPSTLGFVHRFISGKDRRLTLVLLHGTGGNEEDLIPLGSVLAPDASLLSPRGKVVENGLPRFFHRLAEGLFDVEDLKFRSRELADFVNDASATYGFEPKSVALVGYSNGANIAAGMILGEFLVPAAAMLFRPMVPFTPDNPPNLNGLRVFISSGNFDQMVPRGESERLARLLRDAGAKVTHNREDSSHGLTNEEATKASRWLPDSLTE
jgi:predicted esterase